MGLGLCLSMVVVWFFMGCLKFSSNFKHLLNMLVSLEFLVLVTFVGFLVVLVGSIIFVSLVFLVFSVCEGAMGLTILVGMSRSFGSDYLSLFSLGD